MRLATWIFAFCFALATGLTAATMVPAGKAAVVEEVIGSAKLVDADGNSTRLAKGQALSYGDRIVTGKDGRVALRLASRASARMASNSELSFKDPAARKGTFIGLVKGWARFLVGAREPGEAFEVSTDNAVAAVKGTDLEVGVEDNGSTYACVYHSEHHPALSFGDPNGGHGIDLDQGQGATFDGSSFDQFKDLGPKGQPNGDRYQGLPDPGEDQGDGNPSPGGQDVHDKLEAAIQGAMDQLGQDLKADGNWESQDRNSDLASGRVGVDRLGYQVRMSNNLIRSAPDTVVLSTLSQRTSGPNQGVTSATLSTQYNQALPQNWLGVLKLSLTSPSNLNGQGQPIWYQINNVFTAANPVGDSLVLTTLLSVPYLDANSAFTQDYIQDLWAYSIQQGLPTLRSAGQLAQFQAPEELFYNVHASWAGTAAGNIAADAITLQQNAPVPGAYDSVSYQSTASPFEGGVRITYNDTYGIWTGATFATYTQTFHILNGQGQLQALPGNVLGSINTGGIGPLDFTGIDRNLNIETAIDVPGFFKQKIDLLIMPEIFDGMGGVLPIYTEPFYNCNCT